MSTEALGAIPRGPGVYALLFALPHDQTLPVGRRRTETFHAGHYVYVGSALGGLAGRLRRHLGDSRRRHWHVDALLDAAPVIEVWYLATSEGCERMRIECGRTECVWAARLGLAPGIEPTPFAFGASDCRCRTHLFYSRGRPTAEALGWPGVATLG